MQLSNKKRYYTPQFSALATVSVRRLAWALGVSMPKAVDIIASKLPSVFSPSVICPLCKDASKCALCGGLTSLTHSIQPQKGQVQTMRHRRRPPGIHRSSVASHFAVISDFSLSSGHLSLAGLSLYSTHEACTLWPVPGSLVKFACNKRVFSTLKEAQSYITHLKERQRHGCRCNQNLAPFPVLDKGQSELFQEVSE